MAKEYTFRGLLLAQQTDYAGYTTYVFQNLECEDPDLKYVMCTRFPNWDQIPFSVGQSGFVHVRDVEGGKDSWFDGGTYVPYRYSDVHFLKFVPDGTPPSDVVLDLDNLDES